MKQYIHHIAWEDGVICDTQTTIEQATIGYYEQLFKSGDTADYDSILQYIPSLVTDADNE